MTAVGRAANLPLRWRYRAATAAGELLDGALEAPSEAAALAALRRDGLFVVALTPAAATEARWRRAGRGGPTLATATRSVATLLEAGIPLDRSLDTVARVTPGSPWCAAYGDLARHVREGGSLAEGIRAAGRFPPLFAPMLAAAEGTGTLPATMALLADEVERGEALRRRLWSALAYPVVLAASTGAGLLVVLLVVVPRLATLVGDSGAPLPWGTRVLLGATEGISAWGGWVLLAGVLLGGWGVAWVRTPDGAAAWHRGWRRMPVVGALLRARAAARYLGTLGAALDAGVPLLSAMALARGVAGRGADPAALAAAERHVEQGGGVAEALAPLLPPVAIQLLAAGEAAGALAPMARRAARGLEADAEAAQEQSVALLPPVLVAVFGVVVGGVALALLQAIYGLNVPAP
ncbi:MAG: type II secretion system F family protein [Gemmatimonadetes bacterium]|nr:type II secretion system F family protein [Gemmatimonadota bacterium]